MGEGSEGGGGAKRRGRGQEEEEGPRGGGGARRRGRGQEEGEGEGPGGGEGWSSAHTYTNP